jgi:hypothetical protein
VCMPCRRLTIVLTLFVPYPIVTPFISSAIQILSHDCICPLSLFRRHSDDFAHRNGANVS